MQVYQKDTEYLESLLVEQKLLTEKQVEIVKMLGKELSVKDTLLAGTQTGEQAAGAASTPPTLSVPEFKSKLDVFEYKNNFEFEGKLIKAAFMENYGQLLSLVEGYRETERTLKQQLQCSLVCLTEAWTKPRAAPSVPRHRLSILAVVTCMMLATVSR